MNKSPASYAKLELSKDADPESLQRWVVAFCIIKFDLQQGQLIEECYPPGVLSNEEELDVAFSSFPDSVSQNQNHNRSSVHDCMFFFRTRRRKRFQQKNVAPSEVTEIFGKPALQDSTEEVVSKTKVINNQRNFKYLYGYVFNRQRHDERLKRGGEQKSVVILSHNPYSNVFRPLLQIMAPLYFDIGKKALEHIASYVSLWPPPLTGKLMELPIGSAKLKVYLPPANSLSAEHLMIEDSASFMAPIPPNNQSIPQGIFHDADIFGIFRGILLQLWLLWELLLIGEPILIIGPTPPQCSEAVASLISLVAPLPCSVDFRPYFTIHDPEFAQLNLIREGEAFPAMVLGVTNLFFLKALRNIPHVVSVGSPVPNSNSSPLANRASSGGGPGRTEGLGLQQLSLKRFSPSNLLSAVKLRRDGPLCLMTEHKEAVWSTYVPTTKPDTSILNRLIDVGTSLRVEDSMSVVNNEILRRHFLELTTNFLAPFGPYFRTTAPSEGSSPFVDLPPLPPFIAEDFLESLSSRGVGKFLSKRMRPNWLDLYNRFLKGPNFMPWFQSRRIVAEQEQRRLWRQARLKADLHKFLPNMSVVEVAETFNVIERHLNEEIQLRHSGRAHADSAAICQKLKKDLQAVFDVLPKDMQKVMLIEKASPLRSTPEPVKLPGRPSLKIGVVSSSSPR